MLEVLGPVTVVSPPWAGRLSMWHLGLPRQCTAADTTVRAARGFGVTAELASMTPYALPQRGPPRSRPPATRACATGSPRPRRQPSARPVRRGGRAALARGPPPAGRRALLARLRPRRPAIRVAPVPAAADLGEIWD